MTPRRLGVTAAVLFLACAAGLAFNAFAARNSSGTYSLPSGNPVISGTTITSGWANSTLSDIGTELTNSLDRSGRGAMLAPLKLMDGTLANPGLTFSSEQTSGLYRAGSGDVRLSLLDSLAQKWVTTGSEITIPLACDDSVTIAKGLTVTNSTANGNGVTATGNGSGPGAVATGGADAGVGVYGLGGALGGVGVEGDGDYDGGSGGKFLGGLNGFGVQAFGSGGHASGVAAGGLFEGGLAGGYGVEGTARGGNDIGVAGVGNGTGAGGTFAAGTAATGAAPQSAVTLTNGYLSLDGVANPNAGTAIKNALTPMNIPKAWARIGCSSGSCSISAGRGFNVASVATNASNIALTLANAVGPGAVVATSEGLGGWTQAVASFGSSTIVTVGLYTATGTAAVPNDASFSGAVNVVIYGSQF